MRVGMPIAYSGGFAETVVELGDYEKAGLDIVFLPEAYTFDSVSQLGFVAARTTTLEIGADILNVYSRTPALLGMTAAGLDYVSGGRFTLGLGASGPQVIEGFHGMPYTAPLGRTREVVEICRQVWRRDKLSYEGKHFHLPLDEAHGGTGLGKPLKLINHPVRDRIPIVLAALGPKNVALAAEIAEGWEPIFFFPERAAEAFGDALADGAGRRDPALGPLQIVADTTVAITSDVDEEAAALARIRAQVALYVGGMGARGRNFYHDVAVRYGFADAATTVQDLYLAGRKDAAAAALPEELVRGISLVGPRGAVAERVAAFRAAGATTINAMPLAATHEQRVRDIETLKEITQEV